MAILVIGVGDLVHKSRPTCLGHSLHICGTTSNCHAKVSLQPINYSIWQTTRPTDWLPITQLLCPEFLLQGTKVCPNSLLNMPNTLFLHDRNWAIRFYLSNCCVSLTVSVTNTGCVAQATTGLRPAPLGEGNLDFHRSCRPSRSDIALVILQPNIKVSLGYLLACQAGTFLAALGEKP